MGLFKKIGDLFDEAASEVGKAGGYLADKAGEGLGQVADMAGGAASEVGKVAGYVADKAGEGLGQVADMAGGVASEAGKVVGYVADKAGGMIGDAVDMAGGAASEAGKVVGFVADKAGEAIGYTIDRAGDGIGTTISVAAFYTSEGLQKIKNGVVSGIDLATDTIIPNKSYMKNEIEALKTSAISYNEVVEEVQTYTLQLHELRSSTGRKLIQEVEDYVNTLANTPKSFHKAIDTYKSEYVSFDATVQEMSRKLDDAGFEFGTSTGAGALAGAGVAAFAPTAAIAFATTFGTASTGAAIATLNGAAAANAALAWLGGGALAAGGGGMAAGNSLLALAGPLGWSIGGIALVGSGYMMNKKCLEGANEAIAARKDIETSSASLQVTREKINKHTELTQEHIDGVQNLLNTLKSEAKNDYREFSDDQKLQAGALINHITALSGLLNTNIDNM